MRLTAFSIRALKPPAKGAEIHCDDSLPGFGVRVSEGGTKSYVLTHGKLRRRETIGRVSVLKLQDARAEAKRRLAEYTLGNGVTASISWADGVSAFLKDKPLKPRTRKDYTRLLARHFKFGTLKLTEITSLEIGRRIDRLSATPVEQHHAFAVLRTFFRWAHRKHYLDKNPMERMATNFRYKPRERILNDVELIKVWNAARGDTFGTIVKLAVLTGQRTGELKTMTRKMIGEDTVTFPDTKNGHAHTWPTGTMTRQLLKRVPFGTLPNFARRKAALDERSDVMDWTLHDLRRTYASGLAALGVQLPVIERLLNHRSGSFAGIVGVYQRYDFAKEMRAAVLLWEAHLQTLLKT